MPKSHPTTIEELEEAGVRFVRLTWVDLINFVRYRIIPIGHFKKLVTESSAEAGSKINPNGGIMLTKSAFGLVYIALAPGFGSAGEYLYVPDLTSARLLPFAPGHASVMGWFQEKEAMGGKDGNELFKTPLCPRTLLQNIVL